MKQEDIMVDYIDGMAKGTSVSIEATDEEGKHVSLFTTVAQITDMTDMMVLEDLRHKHAKLHYAFLDPVREEGLLINFTSENVIKNIVIIQEGRPYGWKNVNIINLRLPVYGSIHVIISNDKIKPFNRRKYYRLSLGIEGIMQVQEQTHPVLIKDISEGGIAIISNAIAGVEKGVLLEISFHDNSTGAYYRLPAAVVWVDSTTSVRTVYGCRLLVHSDSLAHFINFKQQEKMRAAMPKKKKKEDEE